MNCPIYGKPMKRKRKKGGQVRSWYICENPYCPIIEVQARTRYYSKPLIIRIRYDSRRNVMGE